MKQITLFVLSVLLIQFSKCYRTDVMNDEEHCKQRKHLTFKPSATCCDFRVVEPGINFDTDWEECTRKAKKETLEKTAWKLYACIVKKATGKDEISLQEFAEKMSANYPDDIKAKILEEVKTVSPSPPTAQLSNSNYAKLEKIRVTYYDIEAEVCERMPSGDSKSYGKIKACTSWMEEDHRGGMCCKHSYPVNIRHKTLMDLSSQRNLRSKCKASMVGDLHRFNSTEIMEDNLVEICEVACAMKITGDFDLKTRVLDRTEYWNFNAQEEIGKINLLPSYFPDQLLKDARTHATTSFHLNDTIERMKNYEFADVIYAESNTRRPVHFTAFANAGNKTKGESPEFLRRRFHKTILHVPMMCAIYQELLGYMEYFAFMNCKPEDVTETPAQEALPEQPVDPATTEASGNGVDSSVTEAPPAA